MLTRKIPDPAPETPRVLTEDEEPVEFAIAEDEIRRLLTARSRLRDRPGRPSGALGDTPVAIEETRQLIRRLGAPALRSLRATQPPWERHEAQVGDAVVGALSRRWCIRSGPLAGGICGGLDPMPPDVELAVRTAVRRALRARSRGTRDRAARIIAEILTATGRPLSKDQVSRTLRDTSNRRRASSTT